MTNSSGSWKREFVMIEAQLALRVVAIGLVVEVAGRKSRVKSQVNSRRVHCRRRASALDFSPQA